MSILPKLPSRTRIDRSHHVDRAQHSRRRGLLRWLAGRLPWPQVDPLAALVDRLEALASIYSEASAAAADCPGCMADCPLCQAARAADRDVETARYRIVEAALQRLGIENDPTENPDDSFRHRPVGSVRLSDGRTIVLSQCVSAYEGPHYPDRRLEMIGMVVVPA